MSGSIFATYIAVGFEKISALFKGEQNPPIAEKRRPNSNFERLDREAIVTETIYPNLSGRIYFQGSWWSARCNSELTLLPGEIVCVIGIKRITLLVEPFGSDRAPVIEPDSEELDRVF